MSRTGLLPKRRSGIANPGPKAMNLLRDFPMWLFNDVPEPQPKYARRSVLVIASIAAISIGLFAWTAVSLPWWIALTAGLVLIVLSFVATVNLVDRIVPKKLPKDGDF